MAKNIHNNSLVYPDLFYMNVTNKTFQKKPIPHLTHTMKQKVIHYNAVYFLFFYFNFFNAIFG